MEENKTNMRFEEVLDTEISDIWNIFFPYVDDKIYDKKVKRQKRDLEEQSKPRRYLKFLTM